MLTTWQNMNKEKYWRVFLKYTDNFKGLLWKHVNNYNDFKSVYETSLTDIKLIPESSFTFLYEVSSTTIPDFKDVSVIHVTFDNDFSEKDFSKIELIITDSVENKISYYHNPYTLLFADDKPGIRKKGHYDYDIMNIQKNNPQGIALRLFSPDEKKKVDFSAIKISFLKRRPPTLELLKLLKEAENNNANGF